MHIEKDIIIQDNFLAEEEFVTLRDTIYDKYFPWYFSPKETAGEYYRDDFDSESDPGQFVHVVYQDNKINSTLYESHFLSILEQLDSDILTRIRINFASVRFSKPVKAEIHQDIVNLKETDPQMISSILYMNTNNGYTEFETGKKVESVANRLVTFPSKIEHCGVSQTDEQTRILINFGYLRNSKN
jgi:hypothetical protein